MLQMPKTIISDTSCFIILSNIGELNLLQKVYGQIITTIEIATEFGEQLPDWVSIHQVIRNANKGESSAIALALETPNCTIILDDYKARKIADQLGLHFTGTIGVIVKAKLNGVIPSIKPLLSKIRLTDFRLSVELELLALKEAGE